MQAPEFDLIIRNGSVIDGSGAPAFAADVAVKDGRISKVGPLEGRGTQEIDARGHLSRARRPIAPSHTCRWPNACSACATRRCGDNRYGRQSSAGRHLQAGDTYLRTLLIHGARSVLAHAKEPGPWLAQIQAQARECGDRGAGSQDGQDDLGGHGQRAKLPTGLSKRQAASGLSTDSRIFFNQPIERIWSVFVG